VGGGESPPETNDPCSRVLLHRRRPGISQAASLRCRANHTELEPGGEISDCGKVIARTLPGSEAGGGSTRRTGTTCNKGRTLMPARPAE
jgi:hypothetical protein